MKIRFGVPALATLLMLPTVWAQSNGAAASPAKVGVISVQAAIQSSAEGKQAAAELQSQFAPRQTELDNLRKQIEDASAYHIQYLERRRESTAGARGRSVNANLSAQAAGIAG